MPYDFLSGIKKALVHIHTGAFIFDQLNAQSSGVSAAFAGYVVSFCSSILPDRSCLLFLLQYHL